MLLNHQNIKKIIHFVFLVYILKSNALYADNEQISTLNITQYTYSALKNCLQYKVIGICSWLKCEGTHCFVNETLKVDHYLPDAVVSVYRKNNSNPWDYANQTVDPIAQAAGQEQVHSLMGFNMGYGNESASSSSEQHIHFHEADLIGNPAISVFKKYSQLFLPSQATPFMPYYLSMADAYMWRSELMETFLYPANLVPGVHIVGSLMDNWGAVFPRTGFLNQPADAKAAAVVAQRAADIATKDFQPHVYQTLNSSSCGAQCFIDAVTENSPAVQWQMIYPMNDNQCTVFGENDLTQLRPWGSDAAQKGDGNYTWLLWRHYHGCIQGEGTYMGSIDF